MCYVPRADSNESAGEDEQDEDHEESAEIATVSSDFDNLVVLLRDLGLLEEVGGDEGKHPNRFVLTRLGELATGIKSSNVAWSAMVRKKRGYPESFDWSGLGSNPMALLLLRRTQVFGSDLARGLNESELAALTAAISVGTQVSGDATVFEVGSTPHILSWLLMTFFFFSSLDRPDIMTTLVRRQSSACQRISNGDLKRSACGKSCELEGGGEVDSIHMLTYIRWLGCFIHRADRSLPLLTSSTPSKTPWVFAYQPHSQS